MIGNAMAEHKGSGKESWFEDFLSPEDIRRWTEREIADAKKALELRIKELTTLAADYSSGAITPEKADELHSRYYHRWGEALPGTTVGDGRSDEQILADIDRAARPFTTPRENHKRYRQLFETKPGAKER
jgi:hypothetical protein